MKQLFRLVRADNLFLEIHAGLDDAAHAFFDAFQILRSERPGEIEIVVKTIFDRWSDGYLALGKFFQYCLRHNVGSRMPDAI